MPKYNRQVSKQFDIDAHGTMVSVSTVGRAKSDADPTIETSMRVSAVHDDVQGTYVASDVLNAGEMVQLRDIQRKVLAHMYAAHGMTEEV